MVNTKPGSALAESNKSSSFFQQAYSFIAGDSSEFNLEQRILNWVLAGSFVCCVLALAINWLIRISFSHQIALIFIAVFLFVILWMARVKKWYASAIAWAIVFSLVSTPLGFVTNGGISGGFQYFMITFNIFYMLLVPGRGRVILFFVYLVEIVVCIFFQHSYPWAITGYFDEASRYWDAVFSISLSLLIAAIVIANFKDEYDKERFAARRSLEQTNLLAKNNEYFTQVFAHDIKNRLQSGVMCLGLLRQCYPGDENVDALLNDQKHITRMVLNLVNVSSLKNTAIRKEPVLIKDIMVDIVKEWETKFKQRAIVFEIAAVAGQIYVDKEYMELVWDNLMANAYQHTPQGGIFRLAVVESDKEFCFSFINSGPIIPESYRKDIFTKYYAAQDQSLYNKGLGLHCAALITGRHLGRIHYRVTHDGLNEFAATIPKVV